MGNVVALILAAGKGTRMKSKLPKVVHTLAGVPMINHVCRTVEGLGVSRKILVVGYEAETVKKAAGKDCEYVTQTEQLGTGHAVLQAKDTVTEEHVLVLYGDTPLLRSCTLEGLISTHMEAQNHATVITAHVPNPEGYGHIVRDVKGKIRAIVEDRDANEEEKKICEINTGIYIFHSGLLFSMLEKIKPDNVQGEIYLTDVIGLLNDAGYEVGTVTTDDPAEIEGINSRNQLAQAEREIQRGLREYWMNEGVTMLDPETVFIDLHVKIGMDTIIYPNTYLQGSTVLGSDVQIGPNVRIKDTRVGSGTKIEQAVILDSEIAASCSVGPFAYIRPETVMKEKSKVGTFVEIKKSVIDTASKVPHLTYVGDGLIGKNVNIGAGTIFVNYDGEKKHQTIVEDGAFVGCNANLIAPVTVKRNAYVAAGSTITKEVIEDSLGIARARQENIEGWVKRKRKK
jgi:bifunctional UDP-N-acetylglucosamine pyrophosphorylase / glucosamine-1-phosphate N-acetyltransferase